MRKIWLIIKRNFWIFILFIFPSVSIVNIINDLTYHITMNSNMIFYVLSYLLLFIVTTFFVLIYSVINFLIKNNFFKKILLTLIILTSICFFYFIYFVGGRIQYESCGKEFNDTYIEQSKINNSSFCLNNNIKLNSYIDFKGGNYCKTPNMDIIRTNPDYYSAECLTSFAQYTNDVSHCNIIESNNLKMSGWIAGDGNEGNKEGCISRYATSKLDVNYCELLKNKDRDRDICIRSIYYKTKDKSLCNKINNISIRNDCLY